MSRAGFFCRISYNKLNALRFALGTIISLKKKEPTINSRTKKEIGSNILNKEIPELLIAVSSLCSPRLPKVIKEDNKMARGNAKGTMFKLK